MAIRLHVTLQTLWDIIVNKQHCDNGRLEKDAVWDVAFVEEMESIVKNS